MNKYRQENEIINEEIENTEQEFLGNIKQKQLHIW